MLLFASLSMISVSVLSFAVTIGQRYAGGIVFYVDESRQHGLVAAMRDLPGKYEWQGAKEACERSVYGGFSDWYLPSKWELNELYTHKNKVGGFSDHFYWSSSGYIADFAWFQIFGDGSQIGYYKYNNLRVRPVRAF